MAKSIEQDAQKRNTRIKIGKIAGIAALVLILVWTVYSVATNVNKSERKIIDAFIIAFEETKEPAFNQLEDCSKVYEGQTKSGKEFGYVIAAIRQGEDVQNCLLIVKGPKKGSFYTAQTLSRLDYPDKDKVKLEITERDESIRLDRVQKTLLHYWRFHDVA